MLTFLVHSKSYQEVICVLLLRFRYARAFHQHKAYWVVCLAIQTRGLQVTLSMFRTRYVGTFVFLSGATILPFNIQYRQFSDSFSQDLAWCGTICLTISYRNQQLTRTVSPKNFLSIVNLCQFYYLAWMSLALSYQFVVVYRASSQHFRRENIAYSTSSGDAPSTVQITEANEKFLKDFPERVCRNEKAKFPERMS